MKAQRNGTTWFAGEMDCLGTEGPGMKGEDEVDSDDKSVKVL